ncbi:MAG: hypothetical protein AB2L14_01570 [Candidatus Xenobiia bacterium LiM19]
MRNQKKPRGIALATMFMIIIIAVLLAVTVVGIATSQIRYSLKRNSEIATRQAAISGIQEAKYLVNGWDTWDLLETARLSPFPDAAQIVHGPTPAEQYLIYESPLEGSNCFYTVVIEKGTGTQCRVVSKGYFKNSAGGHCWEKTVTAVLRRDILHPIMINASAGEEGMLAMIDSDIGGRIASSIPGKYFTWEAENSSESGTRDLVMYKPSKVDEWDNPLADIAYALFPDSWFKKYFGTMTYQDEEAKISDLSIPSYDENDKTIREIEEISDNNPTQTTIELEPGKYYTSKLQIANYTIVIKNKSRSRAPTYIYLTSRSKSRMSYLDFGDSFSSSGALTNLNTFQTKLAGLLGDYEFNAHLSRVNVEFEDPLSPTPVVITGKDCDDFSISITGTDFEDDKDRINASILAKNIFMNNISINPSAKIREQYTNARITAWEER